MALMHCHFFSETLGLSVSMDVIIPQRTAGQIGMAGAAGDVSGDDFRGHRTLYLLHGLSDDHTIWQRRTSIERYAAEHGIAVVMPAVDRSFYTDMVHGHRYWTYISEEVPARAREFFRLSDRREDNFVAGLSMGGYGAMKLALRKPEMWAAAASFSGALGVGHIFDRIDDDRRAMWVGIFGEDLAAQKGGDNDLHALARRAMADGVDLPQLYACCGTGDFLLEANRGFRDTAAEIGLPLTYEEHAGFEHEWGYWDERIAATLGWLLGS